MMAPFPISFDQLFEGHRHCVFRRDGDILDRLIKVFFSDQTQEIGCSHLCRKAVIPCGDALHDQCGYFLWVVWLLQAPVDGIGQADGFFGRV